MVKTTIVCNKCGSEDVAISDSREVNVHYGTVLDGDTLRRTTVKRSYEEIATCTCRKCGHVFAENLGMWQYKLLPEETFVY